MTTALELQKDKPVAVITDDPLAQVSMMLQTAIKGGVTPENVSVAKELMGLFKDMQAQRSEREFDDAFAAMQSEMVQVRATKPVENMYKYATYEEIMIQVQPLLNRYSFSVSYNQEQEENRITIDCVLSRNGHKRTGSYTCRAGSGRKGMTDAQIDGAATTTAKRNALCGLLNIVINHSDDKRNLGGPITKSQADSLRERVRSSGRDEKRFLKWAEAASFELIKAEVYGVLDAELRKSETTV